MSVKDWETGMILSYRLQLSKKAKAVLQTMYAAEKRDEFEDAEIVKDGRHRAMLGLEYVSSTVIKELLLCCYLNEDEDGKVLRYTINSSAKKFIETGDTKVERL